MKFLVASVLAVSLLAFVPAASAAMDTQVCLPYVNNAPVYGCTSAGFDSRAVYYYDVDASQWSQKCVWLVCAYTPDASVYPAYLTNAVVPYSTGDFYVKCIKGQYCNVSWDTHDLEPAIGAIELSA